MEGWRAATHTAVSSHTLFRWDQVIEIEAHILSLCNYFQNSGEYFALPITIIIVLMVSNVLALWGALLSHPLLLLPWLTLYFVFILCSSSLLIYVIIILQDIWFQVLLFLVITPELVIGAAFWLVVLKLYRSARHSTQKISPPQAHSLPPTMYTPEPHSWDQPLPIWAVNPPQNAWDPSFLQQIDPRYVATPEPSTRASRSSRTRSFRSRSRSDESYRESDGSSGESGCQQTDSVSLSTKYRQDRHSYAESDREQSDSQSEYQTDGQSGYPSESDGRQPLSDVTEDTAESEEEHSPHLNHKLEVIKSNSVKKTCQPSLYFSLWKRRTKTLEWQEFLVQSPGTHNNIKYHDP